jgi:hypothetical protein
MAKLKPRAPAKKRPAAKRTRAKLARTKPARKTAGKAGSRKAGGRADAAAVLVGTWAADDAADSNVHFTVARRGPALAVSAVDVFDGEKLRVTGVAWDGTTLRFETATPSTGTGMEHELRAMSASKAVYRFTVTQLWKKLPDGEPGE